jgi:hypothetical protein
MKKDLDVQIAEIGARVKDRAEALVALELLLNEVDRLARKFMDADEANTFTVHIESALRALDEMD